MTPAEYEARPQTYTAVQWDGTEESADWITGHWQGARREGDTVLVRDSMDRDRELPRDMWVVREDLTGVINLLSNDAFVASFRSAD